jgi:hypothetical protein
MPAFGMAFSLNAQFHYRNRLWTSRRCLFAGRNGGTYGGTQCTADNCAVAIPYFCTDDSTHGTADCATDGGIFRIDLPGISQRWGTRD